MFRHGMELTHPLTRRERVKKDFFFLLRKASTVGSRLKELHSGRVPKLF